MMYAFTSEKGANRFVDFLAEEMSVEAEVLSYLHVEVDESELPGDPEVFSRIEEMAEQCGADSVLL